MNQSKCLFHYYIYKWMVSRLYNRKIWQQAKQSLGEQDGSSSVEIVALCGAVLILLFVVWQVFVNGGAQKILAAVDQGVAQQVVRYDR